MQHKKLILILLIFCVAVSSGLKAQHRHSKQMFRAYPSFGATASQIRGDELRGFKKWGFSAGVGAIMSLSDDDMWQLSMEADFSQRGSYNNTNDPYSLFQFTLNYVDIPVAVHFTDPFGGMTFGAGLTYSRLVQQPHGLIFFSPNYFVPDTSDMSFLKNDLAAVIDLRFPIWKGLTFNVRYQHSIIPIKKDWHFTEFNPSLSGGSYTWSNNLYNSSITLRILYVFGEQPRTRHNKYRHNNKNKRR